MNRVSPIKTLRKQQIEFRNKKSEIENSRHPKFLKKLRIKYYQFRFRKKIRNGDTGYREYLG